LDLSFGVWGCLEIWGGGGRGAFEMYGGGGVLCGGWWDSSHLLVVLFWGFLVCGGDWGFLCSQGKLGGGGGGGGLVFQQKKNWGTMVGGVSVFFLFGGCGFVGGWKHLPWYLFGFWGGGVKLGSFWLGGPWGSLVEGGCFSPMLFEGGTTRGFGVFVFSWGGLGTLWGVSGLCFVW